MARVQDKVLLGDKITLQTVRGKGGTVISWLTDGRAVLFDQNSEYFNLLAPGQSVEGHVIHIRENYVIVAPIGEPRKIGEPEEIEIVHFPEVYVDDIVDELEKMIKTLSGNAKVIPRALLKSIRLQQLIIRILSGRA